MVTYLAAVSIAVLRLHIASTVFLHAELHKSWMLIHFMRELHRFNMMKKTAPERASPELHSIRLPHCLRTQAERQPCLLRVRACCTMD